MFKFKKKGANRDDLEKMRTEDERKREASEMTKKANEIKEFRHELTNLKPGESIEFPDENIEWPNKLRVGLFGTTGIGKTSLMNSLRFAFKGKLTDSAMVQTSTVDFQGGHTVRRLEVGITSHLSFVDNRGVGAEDLGTKEGTTEIIRQLEGRSPAGEKVNWRKETRYKKFDVDEDEKIYCTVLVFDARNSQSVERVIVKLVEEIVDWQGRYPIGVITHTDVATPDQVENMYAVLTNAGISDSYEVANIITDKTNTTKRKDLSPEHQLNLLALMKRCFNEGDHIFLLRQKIERLEAQRAKEREIEAEEERQKQARLEKEKEEERQATIAKEAQESKVAKEKNELLQDENDQKRAQNEMMTRIFLFVLAITLLLIGIWLGRK